MELKSEDVTKLKGRKQLMMVHFNLVTLLTFLTALKNLPLRSTCACVNLPESNSTQERIPVMSKFNSPGDLVQLLGVSTTEHDIIGNQ